MAKSNIKNYDYVIIDGIWQFHNYAVYKNAMKFNIPYFVFPHGMLDPWFNENYFLKKSKKYILAFYPTSNTNKCKKSSIHFKTRV